MNIPKFDASDDSKTFSELLGDDRALMTGRLAAGVAYALDPPLRSIKPSLQAALEILDAGDPRHAAADAAELLRDALRAAELAERTMRGLSSFATPRSNPLVSVSVHEALELAIQLTAAEVGARAVLVRRYSPVSAVLGSMPRLAAVFVSLLRNAAEAIPPYLPTANRIAVETRTGEGADAGAIVVEIGDTGIGIEPDDLPYVFDPFFTTKPSSGVPGLGLTLARSEIAAIGGRIHVESEAGRGTRVRIVLPAADGERLSLQRFITNETLPQRRVLCVAATTVAAREISRLIDDDHDAEVTLATWDDAVERLALGETFDLVLSVPESDEGATEGFRARLRNVAPEMLARTFRVTPRSHGSGTFRTGGLARVGT